MMLQKYKQKGEKQIDLLAEIHRLSYDLKKETPENRTSLKNILYFCRKRMTKKAKNSRFGLLF